LIRTLIIDPDAELLNRAKSFIEEDEDIVADLALSAEDAKERMSTSRYDAVISEFDLPDQNGLDLLMGLRAKGDEVPFVLFTRQDRKDLMKEVLRHGASTIIQKDGPWEVQLMDLTHRLRQMVERRRADELKTVLIETPLEGILILDLEGEILYANRATRDMIGAGTNKEAVIGQSFFVFVVPEYHDRLIDVRSRIKVGSDEDRGAFQIIQTDGDEIWVEALFRRITYRGEVAVLLMLRDITDRKRIELTMREANSKLNLLSSVTRHDILNQITAIYGYADLLSGYIPDDPKAERYLAKLTEATKVIQRQIAFTKDYENLGVRSPEWQNVGEVIRKAADPIIPSHVTLEVRTGGLEVFADSLLEKAFFNIMENSVRHGGNLKRVRLSHSVLEDRCVMVIEDDGDGIGDEDRPRIFYRGYGKNTGYGLFLSKEILGITGISIIENGRQGEGARFEISVPPSNFRIASEG
jgi:PAS domain S-box-containing protein